jgi:hypothetical protein
MLKEHLQLAESANQNHPILNLQAEIEALKKELQVKQQEYAKMKESLLKTVNRHKAGVAANGCEFTNDTRIISVQHTRAGTKVTEVINGKTRTLLTGYDKDDLKSQSEVENDIRLMFAIGQI